VNFQNSHKHKSALNHDFCMLIDVDLINLFRMRVLHGVCGDIKLIERHVWLFHCGIPGFSIENREQKHLLKPGPKNVLC
jgi:hypothetical protein